MRKIAATYIFPGNAEPLKNGVLVCDDDGKVLDLYRRDELREEAGLEYYSGILVPGFVNAHCHLELSHLADKLEPKIGIGGFIAQIQRLRDREVDKLKAMQLADRKMWAAGITAIGDISNGDESLPVKQKSKIHYHTFVEAFGFHPSRAEQAFEHALQVCTRFVENGMPASVVPHAPYSVSSDLFSKISNLATEKRWVLSIHNQESVGENEFFQTGKGPIAEHLVQNLGIDIGHWKPVGKSSLQTVWPFLQKSESLLLVHNTFTSEDDIDVIMANDNSKAFWVLCPNSNLFIENELPPVDLFLRKNLALCLGTDSLASNRRLSILEEMKTLQFHFPFLTLKELIRWATINGAEALGVSDRLGSFEIGKVPGVNLVTGLDLGQLKFSKQSTVTRLL